MEVQAVDHLSDEICQVLLPADIRGGDSDGARILEARRAPGRAPDVQDVLFQEPREVVRCRQRGIHLPEYGQPVRHPAGKGGDRRLGVPVHIQVTHEPMLGLGRRAQVQDAEGGEVNDIGGSQAALRWRLPQTLQVLLDPGGVRSRR